jgi:hypothetical protein
MKSPDESQAHATTSAYFVVGRLLDRRRGGAERDSNKIKDYCGIGG